MVTIIDYGMGNLYSARKACEYWGFETELVNDPEKVLHAEKLILPGVGAFGESMEQLRACNLEDAICQAVRKGTPLLGICLGMQLLFESSEEGGNVSGLSLLKGDIKEFSDFPDKDPEKHWKVPHMGWNSIFPCEDSRLFQGISAGEQVYFVHSYRAADTSAKYAAAITNYGYDFVSAVEQNNLFATQFHPEKSGRVGMKILKNFLQI